MAEIASVVVVGAGTMGSPVASQTACRDQTAWRRAVEKGGMTADHSPL